MKIGIMQPYFFPYIGYWQLINIVDKYVVFDDVNYINRGWINRNRILFNGEPKYIMFLAERNTNGLKMAFYDTEWKKQPFVYSYPMYEKEVPKPENLEEMLEMSRILSKGFSQVRVDWYSVKKRLIFGEMTFTSYSGLCKWIPEEYNQLLGMLI